MIDRGKVIRGLESLWRCISPVSHTCGDCPYQDNRVECKRRVVTDALALLKEQEKENRALRKLLDWAVECDWGLDNLGDWWVERFSDEIKGMGYTESLIHLARRYIEIFEGDKDDAE